MVALVESTGLPTLAQLKEACQRMQASVIAIVETRPEALMPVFSISGRDAKGEEHCLLAGIAEDFDSPQDKTLVLLKLVKLTMEQRIMPTSIAMVSEAWISYRSALDTGPHVRPSDDPNRKEAVVISAAAVDGLTVVISADLLRNSEGRIIGVGEYTEPNEGESQLLNRFFQLFALVVATAMGVSGETLKEQA